MPTVSRSRLTDVLRGTLRKTNGVDAAWEGSSAAFGNDDALSDVDVVAVVADDAVDATFTRIESALDAPAAACARLEALAFVRDLDDLGAKHEEARRWFEACIARLQSLGPGSGLASD